MQLKTIWADKIRGYDLYIWYVTIASVITPYTDEPISIRSIANLYFPPILFGKNPPRRIFNDLILYSLSIYLSNILQ